MPNDALSPEQEKAVDGAAGQLYVRAVAMHESIEAGRGAVGWEDSRVLSILRALVREVVQPVEKETIAAMRTDCSEAHSRETERAVSLERALRESEKAGAALAEALRLARRMATMFAGILRAEGWPAARVAEVVAGEEDLRAALLAWSQRTPKAPEGR